MLLKILDVVKNYHDNWSASPGELSGPLSSGCSLPSGCDGRDSHQNWKVVGNILKKQ